MKRKKKNAVFLLVLLLAGVSLLGGPGSVNTKAKAVHLLSPRNGATVTNSNSTIRRWWNHYRKHKAYKISRKKAKYGTVPIILKWKKSGKKKGNYQVFLSRSITFDDNRVYRVKENYLKLRNLHCNARYYWKVVQGDTVSKTRLFRTKNMARIMRVKGVKNARDIGGYLTYNGKHVKQGRVYRSGELDKIKKSGKRTIRKRMKINTELDLRALGEGNAGKNTGLARNYINISGHSYESIWEKKSGTRSIIKQMKVFAKRENYPILIHCIHGRDRTGTLVLLLNGLLGVRKKDLYRDYELTFFSKVPDKHYKERMKSFDRTYRYLRRYKNNKKPFSYHVEAFLLDNGMTQEEINMIKEIMLVSSY